MKIFPLAARVAQSATVVAAIWLVGAGTVSAADGQRTNPTGVTQLDKTFAMEAAHGLMRDAALARLAEQRATTKEVRAFAIQIQNQRTNALQRLRQLAKETRLRLPERLDAYQRDQVQKLDTLQGREFDRQFLQFIAETDHTRFYKFELNSGAMPVYPPVKEFAKQQLSVLRADMQKAEKLLQNYR